MYVSSCLLKTLRYGLPHIDPSRYSSLPVWMPLTMKSRLTPYSTLAVTSLSVAPLRFHAPYAAMMSSFHRTHPLVVTASHANVAWDGACQHGGTGAGAWKNPKHFHSMIGSLLCYYAAEEGHQVSSVLLPRCLPPFWGLPP